MRKQMKFDKNGEISIMQSPVNGFCISYNPDDSRWYVTGPDNETRAIFSGTPKGFYNARQYARRH